MQPTAPQLSRATRRLKLTAKQAGPNYYKGFGSGSMGRHTKHGGFVVEWRKVRTYVVPSLDGFHMTPFVSKRIDEPKAAFGRLNGPPEDNREGDWTLGPLSGKRWLQVWKEQGKDRPEVGLLEDGEVVVGR